jgi:hypothetical protein
MFARAAVVVPGGSMKLLDISCLKARRSDNALVAAPFTRRKSRPEVCANDTGFVAHNVKEGTKDWT